MINSIESERLQRLIDRKQETYNKLKEEDPDNKALQYLNSEITLLRDTIMPIVLSNTTVEYSEIKDFVIRSMRKFERHANRQRFGDVLFHVHLKDSGITRPVCGFSSNMRMTDTIVPNIMINGLSEQVVPFYFAEPIFHRMDYRVDGKPIIF